MNDVHSSRPIEPRKISGTEARQGITLGVMRHVLWISLALAIAVIAFAHVLVVG